MSDEIQRIVPTMPESGPRETPNASVPETRNPWSRNPGRRTPGQPACSSRQPTDDIPPADAEYVAHIPVMPRPIAPIRFPRLPRPVALALALALDIAGIAVAAADPTPAVVAIEFARDIRPLLNKHCTACHGGVKKAGNFSLLFRESGLAPAKSGANPLRSGDPALSELLRRVASRDDDERMPPPKHGPPLSTAEVGLLAAWIQAGAPWDGHWAYTAPRAPMLPVVRDAAWCRAPLDRFVLARLEKESLHPSPEADRIAWLRRASLDLTGLPPTPDDIAAFGNDRGSGAHERVVDRLLKSAAYGERWAAVWLDLARYADSQGYEKDAARVAWPWRDWVIRAFDGNLPFDQFTVRLLAGDLLPDATLDDAVASAFHRHTPTNAEGGTDDEEFRVAAVLDSVATT
ncbi:MAG: DUF1549 domain-containing protein, partial [Verrucomicrobia bacterium]